MCAAVKTPSARSTVTLQMSWSHCSVAFMPFVWKGHMSLYELEEVMVINKGIPKQILWKERKKRNGALWLSHYYGTRNTKK